MYEKILVPVDGSVHASNALKNAVQIAKNFNGKISIMSVCEIPKEAVVDASGGEIDLDTGAERGISDMYRFHGAELRVASTANPTAYADVIKCMREASKQILANAEKTVQAEGVQVETMTREGNVVEEIVNTAAAGQFNLIVMGSRGLSTMKELALGSVSDGVMRHASCPVLIVR